MKLLSDLYNVTLKKDIRGKAKEGFIRPTIGQSFMTDRDFIEIEKPISSIDLTQFNKTVYVDANNGSDITGDGSEDNPYASVPTSVENITSGNNEALVLLSDVSTERGFSTSKIFSTVGNKNTWHILHTPQNRYLYNDGGQGTFYQTVLSFTGGEWAYFGRYVDVYMELYNCVILKPEEWPRTIFGEWDSNSNYYFYNCLFGIHSNNISKKGVFTNCASNLNTGQTQLEGVTYDSNYNITSPGWQNTGTGTNPDGSQAHIGVYGGEYAWS